MTNWIISENSFNENIMKSPQRFIKMESTTTQMISANLSNFISSAVNKSIKSPPSTSPSVDSGT